MSRTPRHTRMANKIARLEDDLKRVNATLDECRAVFTKTGDTDVIAKDLYDILMAGTPNEAVADGPCGMCGHSPARGFAAVNETWYCHEGDSPTCYEKIIHLNPTVGLLHQIFGKDGVLYDPT